MSQQKKHRRTLTGVVVSDKMEKTVVVMIEQMVKNAQFKKYTTRRNRYKAHDEQNSCSVGDRVMIEETRPLSRDKRWRVTQTIEKAPQ